MAPPVKKAAVVRNRSDVHTHDAQGHVFKGFQIWSPEAPAVREDPELCYAKCVVLPGSTKETLRCRQIEPEDSSNQEFDVAAKYCMNVNSSIDPLSFPDIGMLPHTNEAAALDFIRQRYVQGQIYTAAKPLLVAVNPFKNLGNATDAVIIEYRDAPDVDKLSPHVFSVARNALENLHSVKKSQTIIVSGESGAGKTEAVKQVMRYFAAAKSGITDTRIQTAILAANPVLEAFGNAKTIRNNNSSRFGRFMQLQVAKAGGIESGTVRNFLLEKSRILVQEDNERSYHIFYQLIKGASPAERERLKLKKFGEYRYINPHCLDSPGIDDLEEWNLVREAFVSMQIPPQNVEAILSIVSGVMLLGNVDVDAEARQGIPDAAVLSPNSRQTFEDACKLLFLDPRAVEEGLFTKISKAGAQEIKGAWRKEEAVMLKDSLAKAMFDKLFDWIVRQLNMRIEPEGGFKHFMAMLDIFGFEVLQNNSLEQLFINITNEMLQKNFTDAVFDRETRLYREEGISAADLVWTTNQELIDVLTGKKASLMTVLEDQCLAPGGTDQKFLAAAGTMLKNCPYFAKPKVGANTNFAIEHTIGAIPYGVVGFLFKNKDVLRAELVEVCQASGNEVVRGMYEGITVEKGKLAKGQLIGSQFMLQLESLMALINITEPHFIRCVRPNETKSPLVYVPKRVLTQLHSLSILEALQLRNLGFSYRRPFQDFLTQFKFVDLGAASDPNIDPREAALTLLKSGGVDPSGFQIGKTMVFMKTGAMKDLATKQRECLAVWTPLVELLEGITLRLKHRKRYDQKIRPGLVRIQARCRQKIAGKVVPPSYQTNVAGWA